LRTVLMTTLVAVVCAVLLVGVRGVVSASVDRNLLIDEQRAVLDALDVRESGVALAWGSAAAVEDAFVRFVRKDRGAAGIEQEFDVFTYMVGSETRGVAIRVFGRGLWGEIRGFVALDPRPPGAERWPVRGLVIYRDEETPGLGKRMRDDDFKARFRTAAGKLVPGLRILKGEGSASGPLEVDGITAATITTQGVQGLIDRAVAWYAGEAGVASGESAHGG
jgi:Na+-transporting NADH:ubiquinone oxidoreductase subunit NqrC